MLILALDTTTRGGSVAVVRDDEVLALVEGDASRTHGERLPGEIAAALHEAALDAASLQLMAVARGPGAFTGLRIGLAAVQGLAMVLDVPVVGVSALDALAEGTWPRIASPGTELVTWMDAQRGEVFSARFRSAGDDARGWARASEPIVGTPALILRELLREPRASRVFAGDGAVRYRAAIEEATAAAASVVEPVPPLATFVAKVGRRLAASGAAGPPHALQPLYVRRPDAELERLRRDAP